MRADIQLGSLAGISIKINLSWLIIFALLAVSLAMGWFPVAAPGFAVWIYWVTGAVITLLFFASVLAHELAHSVVARWRGIPVKSITLFIFGGVSDIEREPQSAGAEFQIAVVGPLASLIIGVVLGLVSIAASALSGPSLLVAALEYLALANLALGVFNLIPGFPMDGGRVLRAALAMRMSHARATELAARIGKAFALLFALLGLFVVGNPFLVLIALFVWFSAAAEASSAQIKAVLGEVPVRRAMISNVQTLSPDESVANALGRVRSGSGFQHDFPVVEDHAVAGVLTREAMLAAIADGGAERPVREVMQRSFVSASPNEPLDEALARLQSCDCRTIPVLEHGQLVGLLTPEKIAEAAMTESGSSGPRDRSAMEQDPPSRSLPR